MSDDVPSASWTAVVLAGGRARRLGGIDKVALTVRGRTLLQEALEPIPPAVPVIVVGERQELDRPAVFVREEPVFAGPAAALAAALPHVSTSIVGLLAGDMPRAATLLVRLVAEATSLRGWPGEAQGLAAVDADGRRQYLCCVLDADALRAALHRLGSPQDRSMRDLLALMAVVDRPCSPEEADSLQDVDTWRDAAAWGLADGT